VGHENCSACGGLDVGLGTQAAMYWLAGRPGGIPQRLVGRQARRGDALYRQGPGQLRLAGRETGFPVLGAWALPGVIYAK